MKKDNEMEILKEEIRIEALKWKKNAKSYYGGQLNQARETFKKENDKLEKENGC